MINIESIDPIEFMKYGVAGLGFLLAMLSYLLLRKEQKIEHPRKGMLISIMGFMLFSIVLCGIGLASEFINGNYDTDSIIKESKTENCNGVDDVLLDYNKRKYFIYAGDNISWGFRVFGDLAELTNIELVYKEDALTQDELTRLGKIFYPIINFSEFKEITNDIRKDNLGVRTKNGYLKFKQKLELKGLLEDVISNSFVEILSGKPRPVICAEIFSEERHPMSPEWKWPYDWKVWKP